MTTDSAVAPDPGEQTIDPATLATGAAQAPDQTGAETVVDIDEQEVLSAKAAAEAEKAAGDGEGTPAADPGQGQQPEPKAAVAPAQQQPATEHIQVPKARLDEVLAQRDKFAQEAAYYRGVADAKIAPTAPQGQQQGQGQPQQPQPTAEERLSAIHSEQDALAKKFDDGEITYSELVKQQRDLSNREQSIREEQLLAKAAPKTAPQQQPNDDLYLDSMTAQLEQQHPWVVIADKVGTAVDWKYVQDRAIENLVQRGIDPTEGNRGKLALRTEVAELFDTLGPTLLADKARAKGIAIPGDNDGQAQAQGQPAPMSPNAQARARKLDLAGRAPPQLSAMNGTNGDVSGTPSESRLESMSDDEIAALPDSTRRKLLGIV